MDTSKIKKGSTISVEINFSNWPDLNETVTGEFLRTSSSSVIVKRPYGLDFIGKNLIRDISVLESQEVLS